MIEELVGYVSSNVKRKQVVDVLEKNGSETLEQLSKLTRIPRLSLQKVVDELKEKDIIIRSKDKYSLTETGEKVVSVTRSMK
jgi:predicted transcriptional regulator